MFHNPDPLDRFLSVLTSLRDQFKDLVPPGQLPVPPDNSDPYSLHNFIGLKVSLFINDDDPNRRDLIIKAALDALRTSKASLDTAILNATTVLDLVEAIVKPSLNECFAAVYDSMDRDGVLALKLSEIPVHDLTDIEDDFNNELAAADWPNRGKLFTPRDERTVKTAIQEGIK